jgi:preprotein translocase subunit SecG
MMSLVSAALPYVQIILSVVLIGAILIQRSEAGLGSGFGGDGFSTGHHERRGFEKTLFYSTIIVAFLFALSAFVSLLIAR